MIGRVNEVSQSGVSTQYVYRVCQHSMFIGCVNSVSTGCISGTSIGCVNRVRLSDVSTVCRCIASIIQCMLTIGGEDQGMLTADGYTLCFRSVFSKRFYQCWLVLCIRRIVP